MWFEVSVVVLAVIALILSIVALTRRGPRGKRGPAAHSSSSSSASSSATGGLSFYLLISDFVQSFITIPTSNALLNGTTIASSYLAGRAPLYNGSTNLKAGICSASFLNMQTPDGIFTDISNYISAEGGLIIFWATPSTLLNLELDSIVNSMVTEAKVTVTTKVGLSLYYGKTFDLVVSSDQTRINFVFTPIN